MKVKLNNNLKDQTIKEIASKMISGMCVSGRTIKMTDIIRKEDPLYNPSKIQKLTFREYFEKEQYPDIKKIRVKSLRKLIGLLLLLKDILKKKYPNKEGDQLIEHLRDLNPNDISLEVLEVLEISKRSIYDYLNTLQMILDYSDY